MSAPTTPAFSLIDHDGEPVTEQTYRDRWLLVFFGFTNCKAVCPRALGRLSSVLDELGDDTPRLAPVYITVDPARDTPAVMKEFLQAYPRFTGLTGTEKEVDEAKRAFRVFAQRKADPDDPDGYDVPHTAITYLVSPSGSLADHFPDSLSDDALTARLQAQLAGRGRT